MIGDFTPGPTDTTVADELALVLGSMQMSGCRVNAIAEALVLSGWRNTDLPYLRELPPVRMTACGPCIRLTSTYVLAVVEWTCADGNRDRVCAQHLDTLFDCADEEPEMEPVSVRWLDGTRALVDSAHWFAESLD